MREIVAYINKHVTSIGIFAFLLLFYYSTLLYPGGSTVYPDKTGYDWLYNFWCDLLEPYAVNGDLNEAYSLAVFSMVLINISLTFFFIRFAKEAIHSTWGKLIVGASGTLSMFFCSLVFTEFHNYMIYSSSLFGGIAGIGVITVLFLNRKRKLLFFAFLSLFLLIANVYLFYLQEYQTFTPSIEKASVFIVLIWFFLMDLWLISLRKIRSNENNQYSQTERLGHTLKFD